MLASTWATNLTQLVEHTVACFGYTKEKKLPFQVLVMTMLVASIEVTELTLNPSL